MDTREIDIDWDDLELAFRDHSDARNYFDLNDGSILTIVPGVKDGAAEELLKAEPARFVPLRPIGTKFTKTVLAEFAERYCDPSLSEQLITALNGHGLKATLDIVGDDRVGSLQFERYEQTMVWKKIRRFLNAWGITAASEPPHLDLFPTIF